MLENENAGEAGGLMERVARWLGHPSVEQDASEDWSLGAEGWIDAATQGGDILRRARHSFR